jgi:hypothetical protein
MGWQDLAAVAGGALEAGLGNYSWQKQQEQQERIADKQIASREDVARLNAEIRAMLEELKEGGRNTRHSTASGSVIAQQEGASARQREDIASDRANLELLEGGRNSRWTEGLSARDAWNLRDNATRVRGQDVAADTSMRNTDVRDATTRRGQDVGAETTRRGQDVGSETTRRGQDIGAETQRRGQDLRQQGSALEDPLGPAPSAPAAVPITPRGATPAGPPPGAAPDPVATTATALATALAAVKANPNDAAARREALRLRDELRRLKGGR